MVRSLLFTHTLNGRYEIFRLDPEEAGSVPQPIVAGRESPVSNDGTIVFRAVGDQDGLWKVGREGGRPIELAKGSVSYPFISADGRRVVFSSRLGGPQTVWQVPTDGGAGDAGVRASSSASIRSRTSRPMANR